MKANLDLEYLKVGDICIYNGKGVLPKGTVVKIIDIKDLYIVKGLLNNKRCITTVNTLKKV